MTTTTPVFDEKDWSNPAFVAKALNIAEPISSVELTALLDAGGNSAAMFNLAVTTSGDEGAVRRFIIKTTKAASLEGAKTVELYRESWFYEQLAAKTFAPEYLAKVHHNRYDLESAAKLIVMEDLRVRGAVQAGYFFGDNSVLNKGKDLAALTAEFPDVADVDVATEAFLAAADLHGTYWCDNTLIQDPKLELLKGQKWLEGKDEERWQASMGWARGSWDKIKKDAEFPVKYDADFIAFMDRSLGVSFDDWVAGMRGQPFSLVHGDFHPANFMVCKAPEGSSAKFSLSILDFEVVGVGSGPQDLGQFMISHPSPERRRAMEQQLLTAYHTRLCDRMQKSGKATDGDNKQLPTLEFIQKEYAVGGLGRWVWLLAVCAAVCPPFMNQYFYDQVKTFLDDAGLMKETILPRP